MAQKARAALESVKVTERVFLSGTRATFTLKAGGSTSKEALATALGKNGLKLESVAREVRPRPAAAYLAEVKGLG